MKRTSNIYRLLAAMAATTFTLALGPALARPDARAAARDADEKLKPEAPLTEEYRLGTGDKLHIEVYKDPQLSQAAQIRPDGQDHAATFDQVIETGRNKIGLLGFSFKAGTDDLRESPIVILAEALLGKGLKLRIYDKNVSLARLVGANKEYIEKQIPHLSSLLCNTVDEVVVYSDVIVVGNQSPEFVEALTQCRPDQIVIDLVRLPIYGSLLKAEYRGICW